MSNKELVAVYGSLRQGFGNHRLLEMGDAILLGTTTITGFDMYSLGAFPYLTPVVRKPEDEQEIVVEVYEVNDTTFLRLDGLEGYPTFYNRKKVHTEFGPAWIYFIDSPTYDSDKAKVESGDWAKREAISDGL